MNTKTACIFLAAGLSSRMKGQNKLLLKIGGEPLVQKSARVIRSLDLTETTLVTHLGSSVIQELSSVPFTVATVTDPSVGMHASIRKGLETLIADGKPKFEAFFVALADQPFLTKEVFQKLQKLARHDQIIFPRVNGERKQPVLIGADFVSEILNHADGDFGCAYLLKEHPHRCVAVDFHDENLFVDIDTPEAFQKSQPDPVEAFHALALKLREERKPYVVATVIEVIGSSSARPGSKAIFDEQGVNLLGWVGGGCAEQHVSEQSLEALKENRTRIIEADLDDEIYGLGIACGGKMNLFLEPIHPAESVKLETHHPEEAVFLGKRYGWQVEATLKSGNKDESTLKDLLTDLTQAIGSKRNKSATSLRHLKELPVTFADRVFPSPSKKVTIVGSTRITEALHDHFKLLGFTVRVVGPLLKAYGEESGPEIQFEPGERVIVASHTAQDPAIVAKALRHDVSYVAMVGSKKRALEVLKVLEIQDGTKVTLPLFVPAGFDIDAKNPDEVALSIVAECLSMTY